MRALISVYDKTGIVEFAKELTALGIEVISTGGTAKVISDAGIMVTEVSEITKFPEILDGRVKTLHPFVHGGILARRDIENHLKQIEELGIATIDIVAVNLYPFVETIKSGNYYLVSALENIDIGGPCMVSAAAKINKFVVVVVDPKDYESVLKEMKLMKGSLSQATRGILATKAFSHTASYDSTISGY